MTNPAVANSFNYFKNTQSIEVCCLGRCPGIRKVNVYNFKIYTYFLKVQSLRINRRDLTQMTS